MHYFHHSSHTYFIMKILCLSAFLQAQYYKRYSRECCRKSGCFFGLANMRLRSQYFSLTWFKSKTTSSFVSIWVNSAVTSSYETFSYYLEHIWAMLEQSTLRSPLPVTCCRFEPWKNPFTLRRFHLSNNSLVGCLNTLSSNYHSAIAMLLNFLREVLMVFDWINPAGCKVQRASIRLKDWILHRWRTYLPSTRMQDGRLK